MEADFEVQRTIKEGGADGLLMPSQDDWTHQCARRQQGMIDGLGRGVKMLHPTARCRLSLRCMTSVMTLAWGPQICRATREMRAEEGKTPALSVVVHVRRYVDVLHTRTCAVTECSFLCMFGSSYRVPETNCVHPFASSLFSRQEENVNASNVKLVMPICGSRFGKNCTFMSRLTAQRKKREGDVEP